MTEKELVELVSTIKERFEELMKDVRAAVRVGAFQAMAEQCGMTGLQAFQAFTRSLVESVERTQENGAKIIDGENSGWEEEAAECLRERGYSLTKVDENVPVENEEVEKEELVEEDEVEETPLNPHALEAKEVDDAKENARYLFACALGFMRNAVMAGVFTRDEFDELATDVADSFDAAWQWREDKPWNEDKCIKHVRHDLYA